MGLFEKYLPPSSENPLGTDHLGRDIMALVFTGAKWSLLIGFIVGGLSILIAAVVATVAAYMGGIWDGFLNSVTNATLIIPSLPILLVIAAFTRMDLISTCLILAVFGWPWAARTIRAQILTLKERAYVDLAKVSGLNSFEMMFTEIVPNLAPYIGVGFANAVVGAILAETALRMIGLGPANIISLGALLNWAMQSGALSLKYYHILLSPVVFLITIFLSLNLINMGLEEIFNPRLKKITGL